MIYSPLCGHTVGDMVVKKFNTASAVGFRLILKNIVWSVKIYSKCLIGFNDYTAPFVMGETHDSFFVSGLSDFDY